MRAPAEARPRRRLTSIPFRGWSWSISARAACAFRVSGSAATTSADASICAATRAVVDAALDAGVTFFDTAESYGGWRQRALPRRDPRGSPRPGRHRDEVRLGRARRSMAPPGTSTRRCGLARATPDRLRRSVLPAQAGSGDADRGDARARSTSSCARARCARSAARTSRPSSWRRPIASPRELGTARFTVLQNQLQPARARRRRRRAPALP